MKNNDFPGFEDIVETIREPLLVLDANLNILSANRSFHSIFKKDGQIERTVQDNTLFYYAQYV